MARSRRTRDIRVAFDRIGDDLESALRAALEDEARQIVWDEQAAINRVTGTLQDSIGYEFDEPLHLQVGPQDKEAKYAVWVEWGRKNADARPFATPASERARRRWPRHAKKIAEDVIRRSS